MARFGPTLALTALAALAPQVARAQITFTAPGFPLVDATPGVPGVAVGDIPIFGFGLRVAAIERIVLEGLDHARIGDLRISLIHAGTGIVVPFCAPYPGWEGDFFGDYTFVVDPTAPTVDDIAAALGADEVLPTGTYAATGLPGIGQEMGQRTDFNGFRAVPLDTTWKLQIIDQRPGATGSIDRWRLTFRTFGGSSAAPEPGSVALTALGLTALAIARRRRP